MPTAEAEGIGRTANDAAESQRAERETAIARRRVAIQRTSGMFTGLYGDNYLAELREDWPE